MADVKLRTESIKKSKGKSSEGSSKGVNRRKRLWTTVEDLILVDYVRQYGERNWANVQRVTGLSRNGKSCRLRWIDQLHPSLNKQPFTFEEEMLISDLHSQVGNKWSIIAEFLPGRTDNAIKNHWYNRRKRYKTVCLPHDQVTTSSNTIYNGFQLNQQNLSPESIPSSEFPANRNSLSPLYHLPSTHNLKSEPLEFSSIQHDAFYYSPSSAQNVLSMIKSEGWFTDCMPPDFNTNSTISSCFMEEAHQFNGLTTECDGGLVDQIQTEGDIVDLWLKSYNSDDGDTNGAISTDYIAEFPSWLNSPSLDEFFDQQSICEHKQCTDDEAINNVAVTEESTNCVKSTVMNEFQDQESISQAMIDVEELPYSDGSLDQEIFCQDLVYCADDGAIGEFAASNESYVPYYEWDETSDFWSTPFVTQMQMD